MPMVRVSSDNPQGPVPGTVIHHNGNNVIVEDIHGQTFQCFFRQHCSHVVVGDHVVWQREKGEGGVITTIAPRKNILSRHGKNDHEQVMAANIDIMLVMFSAEEIIPTLSIDRYLVAAALSKIKAILVINKIDLLSKTKYTEIEAVFSAYKTLGYSVHPISIAKEKGLVSLTHELKNLCSIIVGQSGVGKSSLINVLLPHEQVRVDEISEIHKHGKHTTRGAHLYHLPVGGDLIDSAGIRHFNCWHTTRDEIEFVISLFYRVAQFV